MTDITWTNVTVALDQLQPWEHNPKTSTAKQHRQLNESADSLGQFQTIAIGPFDGNGKAPVYDGHQRLSAWKAKHGGRLAVQALQSSRLLTDQERRKIAIVSRQIGAWDWDALSAWQPDELTAWGFDVDLLTDWRRDVAALGDFLESEEEPEQGDAEPLLGDDYEFPLTEGVPDALWPSDNRFGIPSLSLERQGDAVELPVEIWGAKRRGTNCGTLLFYTEDYRFRALWENPIKITETGAVCFVEPNFSVYQNFPLAIALYRTYQKRWMARYWQSLGVRCFVDLNVNPNYYEVNLLGVPKGWRAWATRGYTDRLEYTEQELVIAREHAETNDILFLVYGGGKKVMEWCENNGAVWISEDMDRAKGLYEEVLYG